MKRYIKSTNIIPNKTIQVGMFWDIDGHDFTVISRNGDTCKITESWISEDLGKSRKDTQTYTIETDKNGTEYATRGKYSTFYSTSAFNYPYDEYQEDEYPEDDYEDDLYTPSSTFGDYSPSSPWNAPGMSISDFI